MLALLLGCTTYHHPPLLIAESQPVAVGYATGERVTYTRCGVQFSNLGEVLEMARRDTKARAFVEITVERDTQHLHLYPLWPVPIETKDCVTVTARPVVLK